MIPRHDDPEDAEDVAGEAYERWRNGLGRFVWRSRHEPFRAKWRELAALDGVNSFPLYASEKSRYEARVRAERESRRKG